MSKGTDSTIDWDAFKAFAIHNLQPPVLLANLRKQRQEDPEYHYCYQYFWRFRLGDADIATVDERIAEVKADPAIAAAIDRIEVYGFNVLIATYEEPWCRDLFVGMKQDRDAEHRMCLSEGLT